MFDGYRSGGVPILFTALDGPGYLAACLHIERQTYRRGRFSAGGNVRQVPGRLGQRLSAAVSVWPQSKFNSDLSLICRHWHATVMAIHHDNRSTSS